MYISEFHWNLNQQTHHHNWGVPFAHGRGVRTPQLWPLGEIIWNIHNWPWGLSLKTWIIMIFIGDNPGFKWGHLYFQTSVPTRFVIINQWYLFSIDLVDLADSDPEVDSDPALGNRQSLRFPVCMHVWSLGKHLGVFDGVYRIPSKWQVVKLTSKNIGAKTLLSKKSS